MRRSHVALVVAFLLGTGGVAHAASPDGAHHARGAGGMFWFMHISDLHIGAQFFESTYDEQHMALVLGEAVDVIHPSFVWATGDLNDGSKNMIPTAGQWQKQWDLYKKTYTDAKMTPGFYYDLPGNHDAYADQGLSYYLANSLWGSTQHKTWMDFSVNTSAGEYYFFGLNSTGDYFKPLSNCCPKFIDTEITELQNGLKAHPNARLAFVAAHHALAGNSTNKAENADAVRAILKDNKAFYLHGDIHAYKEYTEVDGGVVVNEVDSLGKANADNVAIGVVDHDAFVYRATGTNKLWPFIVLTAPVAQDLRDEGQNPWAYAVCKNRKDNPFRALTFSKAAPKSVTVKVGSLPAATMVPVSGSFDAKFPVWETSIDTTSLLAGVVDVVASVQGDGDTNAHTVKVKFTDEECGPLPVDPASPSDGGVRESGSDASEDWQLDDASAEPPQAAPKRDAGRDAGLAASPADAVAGCACHVGPAPRTSTLSALAALVGLLAFGVRRRRTA